VVDLKALAAPTPKEEVKTRPGRGGSGDLSYIDARFAMERLDASVGPENWQDVYRDVDGGVEAGVGIKVDDTWVWKYDVGIRSKIEPVKGGYSDAFKRACVKWGIGRDLYDPTSEVYQDAAPVEQAEKQVVGQKGLTQKQKGLLFATLKEAGIPDDQRKPVVWLLVQKNSVKDMNGDDLDKVLYILKNPEAADNVEHWENIGMLEGVGE
jgi:hypothetical protein